MNPKEVGLPQQPLSCVANGRCHSNRGVSLCSKAPLFPHSQEKSEQKGDPNGPGEKELRKKDKQRLEKEKKDQKKREKKESTLKKKFQVRWWGALKAEKP